MSVEGATVARGEATSYYGRPVLKAPVWTPEVPIYFFTGGLAAPRPGSRSPPDCAGNDELARRAWLNAAVAVGVSPALLISDLGRPERFLNMLRLFKVTSPMSVGSWVLGGSGLATTVAAADAWTGLRARAAGAAGAGAVGRRSGCRSRPTRRRCWRTRPCRCGTRRGGSCRSCSPPAPRRARGPRRS